MNVTLAQELEDFVKEKVRAGQFQSVDELIGSAVAMLRDEETLAPEDITELRREVGLGLDDLDQGRSALWDADQAKAKLRQRLNQQ